jgi:hypothetical protein
MTDQSAGRLPLEQIIYSDHELEWIADRWNSSFSISSLEPKARQSFLSSLRRGFLQLEGIIQSAYEWSALAGQLNQISAKKIWLNAKAAPKASGDERLVRLLADQPSTALAEREQKQCLAVGTLAFLVSVHQSPVKAELIHGLTQQFKSATAGWKQFRRLNCLDRSSFQELETMSCPQVVKDFGKLVDQLLLKKIASPKAVLGRLGADPEKLIAIQLEEGSAESVSSTARAKQVILPDDVSPDHDLFKYKILRDTQTRPLTAFRLDTNWDCQSPAELQMTLPRIVVDLNDRDQTPEVVRRRVHGAARIVSLVCGLSLKKCLRLPIGNRGSVHLNIWQGVIGFDSRKVVRRKIVQTKGKKRNSHWWRTVLPVEVLNVLRYLLKQFPASKTLGDLLHAVGLTHRYQSQDLLNEGWASSHPPEDARFSRGLRPALLALGVHPALVARLSGDVMVTPPAIHWYLRFRESECHQAMAAFYHWAGLTPPDPLPRDWSIGSPKTIPIETFSSAINQLQQAVLVACNGVTARSALAAIIDFHNIYTCSVALQIIWSVGGRGDLLSQLTTARILVDETLMCLSDKRMDRYSKQRICPSTPVITLTRKYFVEHIRALNGWLARNGIETTPARRATKKNSQKPSSAFQIYEKVGDAYVPRDLQQADLVELCKKLGISDINVPRHFLFNELVRLDVAQTAIDSLMGQHVTGAEPHGFGSGLSMRDCCNYLNPILADIHTRVGFKPLIGLGRTAARHLSLATVPVSGALQALPNTLLDRKLEVQDLLIAEAGVIEQDPPVDQDSLVALNYLSRLNKRYLSDNQLTRFPGGSALFCLISFDMVITEQELDSLYTAGVGDGLWAIDHLVIVEARLDSRPACQRLINDSTILAIDKARAMTEAPNFSSATAELLELLKVLDPAWPGCSAEASLSLLMKMAAHAAAIELPGTVTLSLFHKAPFIPAEHLARIRFDRPNRRDLEVELLCSKDRWRHESCSADILRITRHFADKDLALGEESERRNGLQRALAEYQSNHDIDDADTLLIELIQADLSGNPPYKSLKTTIIPEYARKYSIFVSMVRRENTRELDGEIYLEIIEQMGGQGNASTSDLVRWSLLHICSFLRQGGLAVPAGLIPTWAIKTSQLARLPVYTTAAEIEHAAEATRNHFQHLGIASQAGSDMLRLHREAPLRASETRYMRPHDFCAVTAQVHVTSTEHNHLKSEYSRGSISISDSIQQRLAALKDRRSELGVGASTLLFADAHLKKSYAALDTVVDYSRQAVIAVTGCSRFRRHDLRSSAFTDLTFDVCDAIALLSAGGVVDRPTPSCREIVRLHRRAAKAASAARHASVLTGLRYYNCGGLIELATYQRQVTNTGPVGTAYLAAVLGKKAQAIYAQTSFMSLKANVTPEQARSQLLKKAVAAAIAKLPVPQLAERALENQNEKEGVVNQPRVMTALLLTQFRFSLQAGCDCTQVPLAAAQEVWQNAEHMRQALRISASTYGAPVLQSALKNKASHLIKVVEAYAAWLVKNAAYLRTLQPALLRALAGQSASLEFTDRAHFDSLAALLHPWLVIGLQAVLRPGRHFQFGQDRALLQLLSAKGIAVRDGNSQSGSFGSLSFLIAPAPNTPVEKFDINNASPRKFGQAGSLVISGILYGLNFNQTQNS